METIKRKNGSEIKIFAKTIEYDAYEQVKALGNFEAYEDSKIRVMPDCHAGAGCTIGTTMEIDGKVTPNLVGVDIGCGMLTIKLNENEKDINLQKLDETIRNLVPSGFEVHDKPNTNFEYDKLKCKKHVDIVRGAKSLGTLGGGNHFIEMGTNGHGAVFLIIHSGSRNIGNQVAKYYQNLAWKKVNEMGTIKQELVDRLKKEGRQKDIDVELKKLKKPKANKDLAYLSGDDYDDYMNDMEIMQKYASLNRRTMADIILKSMNLSEEMSFETIHNYIDFKRMILRKGAVSAEEGELLLIPINMRDGSLVCVGKGNPDWNYSAPHGAGRLMSRRKAKDELNLKEFKQQMQHIFTTSVGKGTLDEAPDAYKPMSDITDTIDDTAMVILQIIPIYNFKSS